MTMLACPQKIRRVALLAASAAGVMLAVSAAQAQPTYGYDRYDDSRFYQSGDEDVTVVAPRYREQRSTIGAPIQDVAISRAVSFDDLDLRTRWGAHELRARIRYTARTLCNQMDTFHPIATADSPPCYRTAVDEAMDQADAAISEARGYARAD